MASVTRATVRDSETMFREFEAALDNRFESVASANARSMKFEESMESRFSTMDSRFEKLEGFIREQQREIKNARLDMFTTLQKMDDRFQRSESSKKIFPDHDTTGATGHQDRHGKPYSAVSRLGQRDKARETALAKPIAKLEKALATRNPNLQNGIAGIRSETLFTEAMLAEVNSDAPKASSPASNRRYNLRRKISCEEMDERRLKGLCLFCEEAETLDHYLQHKNSGILVIDSEHHFSNAMELEVSGVESDRWLSNSIGCESKTAETENDDDRIPRDSEWIVTAIEKVKTDSVESDVDQISDPSIKLVRDVIKDQFTALRSFLITCKDAESDLVTIPNEISKTEAVTDEELISIKEASVNNSKEVVTHQLKEMDVVEYDKILAKKTAVPVKTEQDLGNTIMRVEQKQQHKASGNASLSVVTVAGIYVSSSMLTGHVALQLPWNEFFSLVELQSKKPDYFAVWHCWKVKEIHEKYLQLHNRVQTICISLATKPHDIELAVDNKDREFEEVPFMESKEDGIHRVVMTWKICGLDLSHVLLKHFRSGVEQALTGNLRRIEQSSAALAASDDWSLAYTPTGSRASSTTLIAPHLKLHEYYWLTFKKISEIYRYKTEEYSMDTTNKFNIYPEQNSPWLMDWIFEQGGYLLGNLQPAHMDFRFFTLGNFWSIVSPLGNRIWDPGGVFFTDVATSSFRMLVLGCFSLLAIPLPSSCWFYLFNHEDMVAWEGKI